MNKMVLSVVLLSAFSWAAPNADEYPMIVHVSSSQWVMEPGLLGDHRPVQRLHVIVNGKKYELEAPTKIANLEAGVTLLSLGDYKAKLVEDKNKSSYKSSQAYEFLFPDKTTKKFIVVGQSE